MALTLTKIQPIHPQHVPEPHWEMAGTTVHGRQLYKESLKRSRGVPLVDENGERVYAKNPISGEPLYPKNRAEIFHDNRLFFLASQGNGQVEKINYRPPTPEEIRAKERAGKIADVQDQLAAAFVDSEIPIDHLIALLKGGKAIVPQAELEASDDDDDDEPDDEGIEYPRRMQRGVYELSTGESYRGKRSDAAAAQDAINAAASRTRAEDIPEPGGEL